MPAVEPTGHCCYCKRFEPLPPFASKLRCLAGETFLSPRLLFLFLGLVASLGSFRTSKLVSVSACQCAPGRARSHPRLEPERSRWARSPGSGTFHSSRSGTPLRSGDWSTRAPLQQARLLRGSDNCQSPRAVKTSLALPVTTERRRSRRRHCSSRGCCAALAHSLARRAGGGCAGPRSPGSGHCSGRARLTSGTARPASARCLLSGAERVSFASSPGSFPRPAHSHPGQGASGDRFYRLHLSDAGSGESCGRSAVKQSVARPLRGARARLIEPRAPTPPPRARGPDAPQHGRGSHDAS